MEWLLFIQDGVIVWLVLRVTRERKLHADTLTSYKAYIEEVNKGHASISANIGKVEKLLETKFGMKSA